MAGIIEAKSPDYIQWEKRIRMAENDIAHIDDALEQQDEKTIRDLHREIDAKYQYAIGDWGNSLYGYIQGKGTVSDIGIAALSDNLKTMRAKLQAFTLGMNEPKKHSFPETNVSVTVNNDVNIKISFSEARKQIEDMTALSQQETEEIIRKINELEKINSEQISKKTKWEKIKPIIVFALDKGIDVAIAMLALIVKMPL